jgi:hypothetical protein
MRNAALMLLAVAGLSVGCAPIYGDPTRSYVRAVTTPLSPTDVVGRWDNVMMLPERERVHVLFMDGGRAEGEIVSASAIALKLAVAAGEIEIAVENVARVDRTATSDGVRRGLRAALHGAGGIGVLGLLTGHSPPARQYAAGAILGAEAGIHSQIPSGSRTVYVAPQLRR